MANCATVDELKLAYNGAYACCDGDQAWQAKVITAKNKRYKEITNA
jgi:hypothetical protein